MRIEPGGAGFGRVGGVRRDAAAPPPSGPSRPAARPRIVEEESILGLSRRARGRVGSRLFNLFFVFVFGLILVHLLVTLLVL